MSTWVKNLTHLSPPRSVPSVSLWFHDGYTIIVPVGVQGRQLGKSLDGC